MTWTFEDAIPSLVGLVFSLTALVAAACLCSWSFSGPKIWFLLPLLMWAVELCHIVCDLWIYPISRSASDSVSWVVLYTYSIYVIFPLRFRFCLTLALVLNCLHFGLVLSSSQKQEAFPEQVSSCQCINVELFPFSYMRSVLVSAYFCIALCVCD